MKLTDDGRRDGHRVGEVGPAQAADPVPHDGGVGGGVGEGGGRGEDAGDGDEVFRAGDVAVEGLEGSGSGSGASHFEAGDGGEVFNAAVTLLFKILKNKSDIALRN